MKVWVDNGRDYVIPIQKVAKAISGAQFTFSLEAFNGLALSEQARLLAEGADLGDCLDDVVDLQEHFSAGNVLKLSYSSHSPRLYGRSAGVLILDRDFYFIPTERGLYFQVGEKSLEFRAPTLHSRFLAVTSVRDSDLDPTRIMEQGDLNLDFYGEGTGMRKSVDDNTYCRLSSSFEDEVIEKMLRG